MASPTPASDPFSPLADLNLVLTTAANVLVILLGVYVAAGLVFALPFVLRGVNRIDSIAGESSWGFRVIIIPGVVALWPILARRWMRGSPPPAESNPHRRAAGRGASS